jgi:branched-subunit amino acid aminotransferase/4-amino-4-deoxychorismate lyase
MKAILNNEIIDLEDFKLSRTNRAFQYGDGLFESIAAVNGLQRLLDKHLERLQKGAAVLRIDFPPGLNFDAVHTRLNSLLKEENISGQGKIKIYLWRNTTGLYSPGGSKADFLITAEKYDSKPYSSAGHVGISGKTINFFTETSRFKTVNALKYVMVGIEKEDRQLDEIIILDQRGFISESLYANIFIKKDNTYLTPSISTGCIEGVMRNFLLEELQKNGFEAKEALFTAKDLKTAQSAFTTNALGIRYFRAFEGVKYDPDKISTDIVNSFF